MILNMFNKSTCTTDEKEASLSVKARREPELKLHCDAVFDISCRKVGNKWESTISTPNKQMKRVRSVDGSSLSSQAIAAFRQDIEALNTLGVYSLRPSSRHSINCEIRKAIDEV